MPGLMIQIEKAIETNVEDIFAHAKSIIQEDIYALNREHYEGYMWVASLDYSTCLACGNLDGHVFDALPGQEGEDVAPEQPIHPHCRCVMVPVLQGMKDEYTGSPSYKDFLARQPEDRLIDILGPSKYALYKKGTPIDRFVKDGKILTLEELGAKKITRTSLDKDLKDQEHGHEEEVKGDLKSGKAEANRRAQEAAPATPISVSQQKKGKTTKSVKQDSPSKNGQAAAPEASGKTAETAINSKLSELRKWGKTTRREQASIMTQGGKVIGSAKGSNHEVTLSVKMMQALDKRPRNSLILLHNHTNSTSFSRTDFSVMCEYDSIKELRVVGFNGMTYRVSVGNGERPSFDELTKYEIEIAARIRQEVANRVKMRQFTKGENLDSIYLSERNKIFAEKYGWEYMEGKLDG